MRWVPGRTATLGFDWFHRIYLFTRFKVFRKIAVGVIFFAVYAYAESQLETRVLRSSTGFPPNVQALLGVALSVLLVFRNNAAYDRWWEGRKLWGQLVNESRTLSQLLAGLVAVSAEEKREAQKLQSDFPPALRDHLRTSAPAWPHRPLEISQQLLGRALSWRGAEKIDGFVLMMLERHVAALMDICGGCERIRRTPLPLSYRACVPQLLLLYLLALPWGMANDLWTVVIVGSTSYFLLSIELISEEIEDPFGLDADDLPLDALCQTISSSLEQVYGTSQRSSSV